MLVVYYFLYYSCGDLWGLSLHRGLPEFNSYESCKSTIRLSLRIQSAEIADSGFFSGPPSKDHCGIFNLPNVLDIDEE